MCVRRLLPHQRGYYTFDASDLDLDDIPCGLMAGTAGHEPILTFGRNRKSYQYGFGRGDYHGCGGRLCAWRKIRKKHGHYAICQVWRKLQAVGRYFFFTVIIGRTDRDHAGGTVERDIQLAFEYRTFLHQVVGKNVETTPLRKNRGFVL